MDIRIYRSSQCALGWEWIDGGRVLGIGDKIPYDPMYHTHRIHVWYIYLHEWLIFMENVAKNIPYMDPMYYIFTHTFTHNRRLNSSPGSGKKI